jgi:PAS domain S-box-containing protein
MRLGLGGRIVLWAVVLAAGLGALSLVLASDRETFDVGTALSLLTGASFSVSGLIAWWRRPFNRTGALMVAVGLTWFAGALTAADASIPFTIGLVVGSVPFALFLHLLLVYPTGTLERGLPRVLVAVGYLVTTVAQVAYLLFSDLDTLGCEECPENGLLAQSSDGAARAIDAGQRIAGVAVVLLLIVVLFRRWRVASAPSRRVLGPVFLTGGAAGLLLVFNLIIVEFSEGAADVAWWLILVALSSVPLAFLAGLVRGRLAKAAVVQLVLELGGTEVPGKLRDALRTALRDPSLRVAYWLPEAESFVDIEGQPIALPVPGSGEAATLVEHDGQRVAAVIHDEALGEEPELVQAACAAAGLALVNERLQAELRAGLEELRSERDFISLVVDNVPALVCVLDRDGRFIRFNRACELASGYSAREVRGKHFAEIAVPSEDVEGVQTSLESALEQGDAQVNENYWITRDGRRLLIVWTNTALTDAQGGAQYVVCTGLDITDRRRAEEELRESEARFRELANSAPVMIWMTDSSGELTFFNQKWLEFSGRTLAQDLGDGWSELLHPDDAAVAIARFQAAVRANAVYEQEYRLLRADGEYRWAFDRATPRVLPDGTLAGYIGITIDITERKEAERELLRLHRELEARLTELKASRARIVEAADSERRRLERNLHDGAQQRLVSLSIGLRMAQSRLRSSVDESEQLLLNASEELTQALQELRELARGIHPAVLTDRGLGPALEALVARVPLEVVVAIELEERLPNQVEAAAYYIVAEAITNVAKYAQAQTVSVSVSRHDGRAFVEVADDGVGGADPEAGSGLRGLVDRVEALDGRLEVTSRHGQGTTLRAEIPL